MVEVYLIFLALVVGATALFLAWGHVVRPVMYATGWVRPTAHDLEVEGWKAHAAGDVPRALEWYARSLELEPCNPELLARMDWLLDENPWARFEWPDRPGGEKPTDGS